MTAADNATAKPARKRISTTAKVFWILLALLFVVVAGFVFSAWRELNRITPPVANPADSTRQVEVLTPTGASQNVPTFVPGKNNTVATASAPAATAAPGTTPKPSTAPPLKTGTANMAETPLQPINVPPAKPAATDKTVEKPAAKPKNTLDNLF